MKKRLLFLVTLSLQAFLIGALALTTGAATQDKADKDAKAGTPDCLACHGPFDKLTAAPADYEAPSGEKTSPHKYIPHADKDKNAIPKCIECHRPHPVPLEDKSVVVKATVDYCYTNCHHAQNLQACSTCH